MRETIFIDTGKTAIAGGDDQPASDAELFFADAIVAQLTGCVKTGCLKSYETMWAVNEAMLQTLVMWSPSEEAALENLKTACEAIAQSIKRNYGEADRLRERYGVHVVKGTS